MSFYTDPWLYNCASADDYVEGTPTAEEIAEQAFIRSTVLAALDYATDHGVTLVAAAGNGHTDYAAAAAVRRHQPRLPAGHRGRAHRHQQLPRPAERGPRRGVGVRGRAEHHQGRLLELRPRRASRSSAPGGWFRDGFGTPTFRTPGNLILSTLPARPRHRGGPGQPRRHARPTTSRCRAAACRHVRLLHLPAGHLDGLAARRRRGGADHRGARPGQPPRTGTQLDPDAGPVDPRAARPPTTPARPVGSRSTPRRAARPTGTRCARAPPPTTASTARAS